MTGVVIDPHLAQCLRDNEPTEPADCLAALVQRRAECEELRAEVARLREAATTASDAIFAAILGDDFSQLHSAAIALDAALTDGGGE
jgi:hypothetical protein